MNIRIGSGIDAHAFADGRALVIGGVVIPHDRGLAGHSDADVLLHAISDAILGALALGDLGAHFPSTAQWKDADSRALLRHVFALAAAQGYAIGNVDATVIAQAPKLAPYVDVMRANIAADLGCDEAIEFVEIGGEVGGQCEIQGGLSRSAFLSLSANKVRRAASSQASRHGW